MRCLASVHRDVRKVMQRIRKKAYKHTQSHYACQYALSPLMPHQEAARKDDIEVTNAEEVNADDVTDCEETEQDR